MRASEFKEAMRTGKTLVGFQQFIPSPALTEMAGYDWAFLCTEHGSLTIGTELENLEVGWEKWTPKLDKLERRRCQDEAGPARKVYQGIPAGSSEAGIGRESVIARGRASVVLTAIDVGVLGEAM